jgi:hypothetical protein
MATMSLSSSSVPMFGKMAVRSSRMVIPLVLAVTMCMGAFPALADGQPDSSSPQTMDVNPDVQTEQDASLVIDPSLTDVPDTTVREEQPTLITDPTQDQPPIPTPTPRPILPAPTATPIPPTPVPTPAVALGPNDVNFMGLAMPLGIQGNNSPPGRLIKDRIYRYELQIDKINPNLPTPPVDPYWDQLATQELDRFLQGVTPIAGPQQCPVSCGVVLLLNNGLHANLGICNRSLQELTDRPFACKLGGPPSATFVVPEAVAVAADKWLDGSTKIYIASIQRNDFYPH